MQLTASKPKIQRYSDYRSFLIDFEKFSRETNPHWSYGSWAKKLGIKSKSQLIMTIQGSRKLSPRLSQRLVQYFKFSADEESYFKRLIAIEAKEKTAIHQVQFNRAGQDHKNAPIEADDALLQDGWLAFVVKEAAAALGQNANVNNISSSICTNPEPKKVASLLESLVRAGYLAKEISTEGKLSYLPTPNSPDVKWTKESMQKLHADGLRVCESQGKNLSGDERVFQTSFMRIRKERLAEARILLQAFQKEFMRDMEEEDGNEVIQLNLHLFPVTSGLKD